jgi:hypothetical protein
MNTETTVISCQKMGTEAGSCKGEKMDAGKDVDPPPRKPAFRGTNCLNPVLLAQCNSLTFIPLRLLTCVDKKRSGIVKNKAYQLHKVVLLPTRLIKN